MGIARSKAVPGLSRFRRATEGAAAIEFALVAAPFLFTILATMEIAMVMWKSELLEKAVATASRKIYTGEFQTDTANANQTNAQLLTKVKTTICGEVSALISCDDVAVDVRQLSAFTTAPPNPVTAQKTYNTSSYGYGAVGAKQIGLVTASFEYKTFFPPLSGTALANGNRVIMATAAFRVEPYAN